MRQITLSQGLSALVDDDDYLFLSQWHWYAAKERQGKYRAIRKEKQGESWCTVYMHRVIMRAPKNKVVDHINGDSLDNQRHNLRLCTQRQNAYNRQLTPKTLLQKTSPFKGVSFDRGRWRARLTYAGKNLSLGTFNTEQQAARAYDEAALNFFGEFAHVNFPSKEIEQCTHMKKLLNNSFLMPNGSQAEEVILKQTAPFMHTMNLKH